MNGTDYYALAVLAIYAVIVYGTGLCVGYQIGRTRERLEKFKVKD